MRTSRRGAAVASAVASLFIASAALTAEGQQQKQDKMTEKAVKCLGANECKGKSSCQGANNDCAGKNGCKGQGFTMEKSAKACEAQGGKVASK